MPRAGVFRGADLPALRRAVADGRCAPHKIEDDLAAIRGDVRTLRLWIVTLPLIVLALYFLSILLEGFSRS
ncbi:MAG TPA: hypothetical protein VFC90_05290 [Planctomycetota bacterium]|nr:hypothetical protein [Planctomycetota bacterium]